MTLIVTKDVKNIRFSSSEVEEPRIASDEIT
jgi:hypothetical protein